MIKISEAAKDFLKAAIADSEAKFLRMHMSAG